MKELTNCPYCQGDFVIKEVECQSCQTRIRGSFKVNRFHMFTPEDLYFIEIFLKNEGNIKHMEKDLKISYPTVKSRLKSIIKNLGYTPTDNAVQQRVQVLKDLKEGRIDVNSAVKSLGELK
ncbi:MAG TPA: DUF2089 domain-containing protein [Spirochaetota bacterium]|nr:DUF2089 domain-containing protein [Spirochaetota bacterium]